MVKKAVGAFLVIAAAINLSACSMQKEKVRYSKAYLEFFDTVTQIAVLVLVSSEQRCLNLQTLLREQKIKAAVEFKPGLHRPLQKDRRQTSLYS